DGWLDGSPELGRRHQTPSSRPRTPPSSVLAQTQQRRYRPPSRLGLLVILPLRIKRHSRVVFFWRRTAKGRNTMVSPTPGIPSSRRGQVRFFRRVARAAAG